MLGSIFWAQGAVVFRCKPCSFWLHEIASAQKSLWMMQNFVRPASRTLESHVRRLYRNWHDVFLRDLVGSNQHSGRGGNL